MKTANLSDAQVRIAMSIMDRTAMQNRGWARINMSAKYAIHIDEIDCILYDALLTKEYGGRDELRAVRRYFEAKQKEMLEKGR